MSQSDALRIIEGADRSTGGREVTETFCNGDEGRMRTFRRRSGNLRTALPGADWKTGHNGSGFDDMAASRRVSVSGFRRDIFAARQAGTARACQDRADDDDGVESCDRASFAQVAVRFVVGPACRWRRRSRRREPARDYRSWGWSGLVGFGERAAGGFIADFLGDLRWSACSRRREHGDVVARTSAERCPLACFRANEAEGKRSEGGGVPSAARRMRWGGRSSEAAQRGGAFEESAAVNGFMGLRGWDCTKVGRGCPCFMWGWSSFLCFLRRDSRSELSWKLPQIEVRFCAGRISTEDTEDKRHGGGRE